jgi:hypothetical protein
MSQLPKSLAYCSVFCSYQAVKFELDQLPPNLAYLDVPLLSRPEVEQLEQVLPKSLRYFMESDSLFNSSRMAEIMPNLESLSKYELSPEVLQNLPSKLTSLYLSNNNLSDIPTMPNTLTDLRVCDVSPELLKLLPRGLKRLKFDNSTTPLTSDDLADLPPQIASMTFWLGSLSCFGSLKGLPKTMKDLSCVSPPLRLGDTGHHTFAYSDTSLVKNLPLQLEVLSIRYTGRGSNWISWCRDLGRLEALTTFNFSINPRSDDFEHLHVIFTHLPRSLTALLASLGTQRWTFTNTSVLHNLPPNLRLLSISSPFSLVNEHFASLPSTLTTLSIPSVEHITSEILNLIPPTILYLSLHHDIPLEDIQAYYERPIWEGYAPPEALSISIDHSG